MHLRQLQCFVAAAELENFTSASERLHMSQSALSRQIANLEGRLGISLFEREDQRVRLTPAGRRLKPSAEMLLKASEAVKFAARAESSDSLTGHVTLAAAPSQAGLLFPRLARTVATDYSGIKLRFIDASTLEAETLIQNGGADFALITSAEEQADIVLWPLFSEPLYVYHPSAFKVNLGAECSLAEAMSLPLIIPDAARERQFFEHLAARCGVALNIAYESNQHHLAIALSKVAEGAVLLPASALYAQKSEHLRPVTRIRDFLQTTSLVSRSGRQEAPAATVVERLLRLDVERLQAKGVLQ